MRSFCRVHAIGRWEWIQTRGLFNQEQYDVKVGFRCHREILEIPRADGQGILQLRERRYSIALNVLPTQRPCGKFTLLSAADEVLGSPGTYTLANFEGGLSREKPWLIYGLLPAGLHTGISAFQIQICASMDAWEAD